MKDATMKDAARQFANKSGKLWSFVVATFGPVPPELIQVADLFVKLQEARHQAEYDRRTASNFSRAEYQLWVTHARNLIRNWEAARTSPQGQFFLLALLLKDLARFAD